MQYNLSKAHFIPLLLIHLTNATACGDFKKQSNSEHNTKKDEQLNNPGDGDAKALPKNLDPKSWSEKLDGLKTSAANIASNVNQINTLLSQMFEVKISLCSRQAQLFSYCIVHAPLAPSIWRASAACQVEQRVWDNRSFRAKIQGVNGRYRLILDNSIESNPFDAGEERSITWTSTGTRSLRDLKLSDVGSMKIKAVDSDLQDLKNATFSFKVDNDVLLSQEHLLHSTRTKTTVQVSTVPFVEKLSSDECRVADNELDLLSQEAIARAQSPSLVIPPEKHAKTTQDEIATLFEEWIFSTERLQQARTDTFLAVAQDISRLRRDLRGDLQLGCWGKEQIKTVELRFKGNHLPLSDWDRAATKETLQTIANPRQTTIDLGGGLRFTNPDESTFPLFHNEGRWLVNVTTDLTLGDINSIQIRKDGVGYQTFKNCWSTWGGFRTACELQNRERDRYQLLGLSVLINGQQIYQRDAIGFNFQKGSLTWIEKELTANPSYIDIMRRRDCPVNLITL